MAKRPGSRGGRKTTARKTAARKTPERKTTARKPAAKKTPARKATARKTPARKSAATARERIGSGKKARYIRRKGGKFTTDQVGVGRSLAADRRRKAKTTVKRGQGDKGDVKRSAAKRKR